MYDGLGQMCVLPEVLKTLFLRSCGMPLFIAVGTIHEIGGTHVEPA